MAAPPVLLKGGFSQVISWVQNVICKTRPYTPIIVPFKWLGRTPFEGARHAPLRFGLGEFCLDAQFHTFWLATLPR
ncbi:MAG: hypothetical protein RIG63_19245 [Coleofasciculus chthonoplastes F3-SA18-01]|uniref:hypothetical protein n=1 Tax=Coleofasciculus chthonoplastes TaxID=64178 RepID=UPI0032F3E900